MAKPKPTSKSVPLSSIVAQDSHIFRQTFISACRLKHGMSEGEAGELWSECLERELIVHARQIGSPPGVILYTVALGFADLTIKTA